MTSNEEAYDIIGTTFQESSSENTAYCRAVCEEIAGMLSPGTNVLDIGCGTGVPVAETFVKAGHNVTGIDFSQTMVDLAQRQVPEGSFIKADMRMYEPPANLVGQYGAIIASNSLYHVSVDETVTMVQRFTNWIKDGGVVVIGCGIMLLPNGEVPPFDESGWKDSVEATFLGQKVTGTLGSMDAWKKLLEKFGLRLVKIDTKDITFSGGGQRHTVRKSYLITRKSTD
ncbi:hypothetical protein M422DRAFT_27044 [Sphaerobolus stellatus SS14]|nr:hypothetical protein M422DRAFT_27044 [Sphaerobolus stellatus SS14]